MINILLPSGAKTKLSPCYRGNVQGRNLLECFPLNLEILGDNR